jgi:hypothetical protein
MLTGIRNPTPPITSFDKSTDGIQHLIGGTNIINYMAQVGMTADLIWPYSKAVMDYAQKN